MILALNIIDAVLTIIILDHGGWEMNPFVRTVIEIYGERFWVWKFLLVSCALILLCIHSKFRAIMTIIVTTGFIYASVVLYEIFLLLFRINPNS